MAETSVESILEAARAQFQRTGIRRTSGDDIARSAGVNRATLYRRVGTKDEIVRRTYIHETQRVLAVIEKATGPVPTREDDPGFDPVAYIERFFTVVTTQLRENQLLHQLLEIDQDDIVIGLTLKAGDPLTLSSALVADRIRTLRAYVANTEVSDIDDLAGTLARISQSLLLTPDAPPRLDTAKRLNEYARRVIAPMILGR
ncbi:MAG TPA: helix-turn-helix domain-containing protein [Marmoricola sp.]|jgi:AcrR family transcriptional regulator|nr:helix-turn-helix domain-containing protein [Marmoricola sp.]